MATELHPQAETLLHDLSDAGVPPLYRQSVADARETYLDITVPQDDSASEPVDRIIETDVEGPNGAIPVRLYEPETDTGTARPALAFFHGGGWLVGDLATHDPTCRALANATGAIVMAVEYRRAPEARFPAALEDCYAATNWLATGPSVDTEPGLEIDSERIAVGGDSAGGTLAAGVTLLARDRDGPDLRHQLLVYPAMNHGFETESYTENANGYFITRDDMKRFWDAYLETDLDGVHPYASPLRAGTLDGVPSATVLTCGFDPLRDEGRAYADRLEAVVDVNRIEYDDMIHGFLTMLADPEWDRAREAIDILAEDLRTAFET